MSYIPQRNFTILPSGPVNNFAVMDWIKANNCPPLTHRWFVFGEEHRNDYCETNSLVVSSVDPATISAIIRRYPPEKWDTHNGMKWIRAYNMFITIINGEYYYMT